MKKEKINSQKFYSDLKSVKCVMVLANRTNNFFVVTKTEVLKTAENTLINYYLTDTIFVSTKKTMLIL